MPRSPHDPLETLQREAERLWRDLVYRRHPTAHFGDQVWSPPVDVAVSERKARVLIELAGVPHEGVKVRLQGNVLEIAGRRTPPREFAGARYHRAEIYFGEFRRVVELPWDADPNSVEAFFRDGMLEVCLEAVPAAVRTDVPVREISP